MHIAPLDTLHLYFQTARHLTPRQLAYQLARRVQRNRRMPTAVRWRAERLQTEGRAALFNPPADFAAAVRRADDVLAGRFRFLDHEERFDVPDWTIRHVSHLWSYHLQYQDYAVDLARAFAGSGDERYLARFLELTTSWVRSTAGGAGDGWEPYALSLRTANWLRAIALLQDDIPSEELRVLLASLGLQLAALERQIEWHIGGNHVLKNMHALSLAWLLDPSKAAGDPLRRYWRELERQVLPDGGHYERSPMYHAIALCDTLELISLMRTGGPEPSHAVLSLTRTMYDAWLRMTDLRGRPALFNDSVHSGAPTTARIDALADAAFGGAGSPADGAWALPHTGYYGYTSSDGAVRLSIDCGDVGAAEQPAHAHCDMLSFELDLFGRPVVVDSGVHGYEGDRLREYVRSTRAHSTVIIAGREQSEMWATFRVARRARPGQARSGVRSGRYEFTGEYSPFHDRGATHRREIVGTDLQWTVRDVVQGAEGRMLQSFIHLHPDFELRRDSGALEARAQDLRIRIHPFGADEILVHRGLADPAQGWHCPDFGVALAAPVIELVVAQNRGKAFGYTIDAQLS